ncbi:MAG: RNA polymerase sigma factor [Planctomycetes bacterium]|nr:RNA polymerase sigma factor [Planctomycetota bacterium]
MLVSGENYLKDQLNPAAAENDMTDDKRLVERFNQGDKSAFDRIVEKYSEDVAALANRLLSFSGNVDDVIQDVFLSAFLALRKFRHDSSLQTWLFRITVNKCRTHQRKRTIRAKLLLTRSETTHLEPANSSDKQLMDRETFDQVRLAVKSLPVKYREPVVLRYLQELSMSEICSILRIKENALHVRLSRARGLLKEDLAKLME